MIIKSHIRGGFRSAAAYLKEQGQNEKTRLVEISDPHAKDLDEAFHAMWAVAHGTKVKKPLHHVSINPMKDERLTDKQVRSICKRLEGKYGYRHGEHQRVIVEHIKEGRQHFHVIWNRVSLKTGKPHYPYMHKKQSKITAREMEAKLGLKKAVSHRQYAGKVKTAKMHTKIVRGKKNHLTKIGMSHLYKNTNTAHSTEHKTNPKFYTRKTPPCRKLPQLYTGRKLRSYFRTTYRQIFGETTLNRVDGRQNLYAQKFLPGFKPKAPTIKFLIPPLPGIRITREAPETLPVPARPIAAGNTSGMCLAQRSDFMAACEGKITWAEYFQKWGRGGPTL